MAIAVVDSSPTRRQAIALVLQSGGGYAVATFDNVRKRAQQSTYFALTLIHVDAKTIALPTVNGNVLLYGHGQNSICQTPYVDLDAVPLPALAEIVRQTLTNNK